MSNLLRTKAILHGINLEQKKEEGYKHAAVRILDFLRTEHFTMGSKGSVVCIVAVLQIKGAEVTPTHCKLLTTVVSRC